ncbi:MAG: tRNA 2-thiouridine(34) synthase MnmA [Verrucomicrobia bacterium]|nr:tRNA 2-thiouridine(34) synthase MnmA [Verrucomicrobiota bacterium]
MTQELQPAAPRGRIAIGLSGGIDSSAAATRLQEQGWDVVGFTLHMFKEGSRCCSIEDVNRARRVCGHLGIPHHVINVMDRFMAEVIAPFTAAYASGRTPNPCIACNRQFKFGVLLERALDLGCTHIATGHYVRIHATETGHRLMKGTDPGKDQSYFLHRLTAEQLARAVFPLGTWLKRDVRAYVKDRGIPTEGARETADLCFITGAGPAPLIERFHPEIARPGEIRDTSGRRIGTHSGIHHFTIGQREGLGVALGRRMYVKAISPADNSVVIADRDEVLTSTFSVEDLYWMDGRAPNPNRPMQVRTRYRQKPVEATLELREDRTGTVITQEPIFAITPGQAAVFHHDEEVLGGGWISESVSKPRLG